MATLPRAIEGRRCDARRSGADEGGQAFGSSRAPRRGNSLRGGIGLASGVEEEALFDGRLSGPGKRRNRHGFRRGSGLGDDQETGRRDRRVSGSVVHCSREDNALEIRWNDPPQRDRWREPPVSLVGSSRATSAIRRSGIERSPGAKQAFTENGRGAGAHDRVIDGRIGSYVSRVNGAGRRKTVRFQAR